MTLYLLTAILIIVLTIRFSTSGNNSYKKESIKHRVNTSRQYSRPNLSRTKVHDKDYLRSLALWYKSREERKDRRRKFSKLDWLISIIFILIILLALLGM